MKNSLKKYLISIAIVTALFTPLLLPAYAKSELNPTVAAATKQPESKKEIAFRFIMAMVGVATSSILIYVGLSVYNKLFKNSSETVVGLNSLRTPENFKEAINIFIRKTDWD